MIIEMLYFRLDMLSPQYLKQAAAINKAKVYIGILCHYQVQNVFKIGSLQFKLNYKMLVHPNQSSSRIREHSYSQQHLNYTAKKNESTTIVNSHHSAIAFKNKTQTATSNKFKNTCKQHLFNSEDHYTFVPEIHTMPFEVYHKEWSHDVSRQEKWQALIKDTRQRNRLRSQMKMKQEQAILEQCTFSPQINHNDFTVQENIFDRLHEDFYKRRSAQLQKQQQLRDKQQQQLKRQSLQNGLFKAKTILNKQKYDLSPLYTRLEAVIRQKKQNRKLIAQRQTNEYTFQPSINKKTNQMLSKKQKIANVVDRLLEQHRIKELKINELRQRYDKVIEKELTFSPVVNNYMPIQQEHSHKRDKHNQEIYPFQPQINHLSALITQERKYETEEEKLFRMHNAPVLQRAEKLNFIEAQVYAQCHFNPQINELSRMMNCSGHKHHNCPVPVKEQPTHHPKINQVSECLSQGQRAKSLEMIKMKTKVKAEAYSKENEYSAMKECSFRPQILKNQQVRSKNAKKMSVAQVAGFSQYYKNIEKAQQRQRQKKLLQQRIFNLQKQYDQRMQLKIKKNLIHKE